MKSQLRSSGEVKFHRVCQDDHPDDVLHVYEQSSDDETGGQLNYENDQVQLLADTEIRLAGRLERSRCKSGDAKHTLPFIRRLGVVLFILLIIGCVIAAILLSAHSTGRSSNTLMRRLPTLSLLNRFCSDSRPLNITTHTYTSNKKVETCSGFSLKPVWHTHYINLSSSSAVRFVDVNCDGILDVIVGFTSALEWSNEMGYNELLECLRASTKLPDYCYAGIMALDGITGKKLWTRSSTHEVFAIQCSVDINSDGFLDCFAAGRGGVLFSVEARNGNFLWMSDNRVTNYSWNFLTPQVVRDFDNDGINDIVVSHGGDRRYLEEQGHRGVGLLLLLSGRTGKALSVIDMPDSHETYMSPIIHQRADGKKWVLFGSGGETVVGSLWSVELEEFAQLGLKYKKTWESVDAQTANIVTVVKGRDKGASNPPTLVDLNSDSILDIVMPMFDGQVLAFNGIDYTILWSVDFGKAESYVYPCIGLFNSDAVPDVAVIYQEGDVGEYDKTVVAVLDGKTGKFLYRSKTNVGLGTASAPLAVHMLQGNDWIIYWKGKEQATRAFKTVGNGHQYSRRHEDENVYDIKTNNIQLFAKTLQFEGEGQMLMELETGVHSGHVFGFNFTFTKEFSLLSTPSIADLDNDGVLDFVLPMSRKACFLPSNYKSLEMSQFDIMKMCHGTVLEIHRMKMESDCPVASSLQQAWLSYLGTYGDGVYMF